MPNGVPHLILSTALKALGTPKMEGVMLPLGPIVCLCLFCPPLFSGGVPLNGKVYAATSFNYAPLLILFPSLKRWGPPRRQGLCSYHAHLWATAGFVPSYEVSGIP